MKRKIIEVTKHRAADMSCNYRGVVKFVDVATLHLECGHRKIIRGRAQPVPKHETMCKECDRELVVEHFEDKRFVKQAAKAGAQ